MVMSARLRRALQERPERILALMLSAPNGRIRRGIPSLTVDFEPREVVARIQPPIEPIGPALMATKETIYTAILLHHIISERGEKFAFSLVNHARHFAERAAIEATEDPSSGVPSWFLTERQSSPDTLAFIRQLDVNLGNYKKATTLTQEALGFLEDEGLAIDPAFTPEMMVLVGLIPMQFSVRTAKGDSVCREIKFNAPLWSLDITRGTTQGQPYTDWEFCFRGIQLVRRILTTMASEYLSAEAKRRSERGQPVLPPRGSPEFD